MDTTKLLADAQQVVADIQAIPAVPPAPKSVSGIVFTDAGITVNYSDGSTANFTPAN
jgi:hypothetical protein